MQIYFMVNFLLCVHYFNAINLYKCKGMKKSFFFLLHVISNWSYLYKEHDVIIWGGTQKLGISSDAPCHLSLTKLEKKQFLAPKIIDSKILTHVFFKNKTKKSPLYRGLLSMVFLTDRTNERSGATLLPPQFVLYSVVSLDEMTQWFPSWSKKIWS
jgi:hypothetical protein